jgi:hypothetical protein
LGSLAASAPGSTDLVDGDGHRFIHERVLVAIEHAPDLVERKVSLRSPHETPPVVGESNGAFH